MDKNSERVNDVYLTYTIIYFLAYFKQGSWTCSVESLLCNNLTINSLMQITYALLRILLCLALLNLNWDCFDKLKSLSAKNLHLPGLCIHIKQPVDLFLLIYVRNYKFVRFMLRFKNKFFTFIQKIASNLSQSMQKFVLFYRLCKFLYVFLKRY